MAPIELDRRRLVVAAAASAGALLSGAAVGEMLLAKHPGGRCEPWGDDLAGSTIELDAGRELVPGLD